jgi:hypothetical protein
MRYPLLLVLAALYFGWGGYHWLRDRPVHPGDGVLAPADPEQVELAQGSALQIGRWSLTPRATYRVTARILSKETYHFDALADLIPEDLALGWGPMSDNRVLKSIEITQSNRFYFWHADFMAISREDIVSHSANTHVIPGNALVAKQLLRLRPGQVVTLTGELVDGHRSDGLFIHTSMTRTDSGAGACEVMLVSDVRL